MGRSFTPKYAIKSEGKNTVLPLCWDSKYMGKPTSENIEKMVVGYLDSCKPGGVNEHISKMSGVLPNAPKKVWVVSQKGADAGEVKAVWIAPMFMVV